jgi:SAM-dependent methyltransferase
VTIPGMRVLDVGAGTGIASVQFVEAGADVLAVEPDGRMLRVAARKELPVEQATFEDWPPAGRLFDLVVFAQSFHWVEPRIALTKVIRILRPGGRLVLLSNRIRPTSPTPKKLEPAYAGLLDISQRPSVDAVRDDGLGPVLMESGFTFEQWHVVEQLRYSTDDWIEMVCTYSNILTLEPSARIELRSRLARRIGAAGVGAQNAAIAVVCTPRRR